MFGAYCKLGRRTSPGEATLTRLIWPLGALSAPPVTVTPEGTVSPSSLMNVRFPPTTDRVWPSPTCNVLPWRAIAAGFGFRNPKASGEQEVRILPWVGSA